MSVFPTPISELIHFKFYIVLITITTAQNTVYACPNGNIVIMADEIKNSMSERSLKICKNIQGVS